MRGGFEPNRLEIAVAAGSRVGSSAGDVTIRRVIDSDVLQHLEGALEDEPDWLTARTRLQHAVPEGRDDAYRAFVYAFGYMLLERAREDARARAGGTFGAAMSSGDWQFPPPLAEVSGDDVDAWREACELLQDPVSSARLHDLLWECRAQPRPDQHARAAADAYLKLADLSHWHVVERSRCLSRALELCRAVKDDERFDRVLARCMSFIAEILAMEARGPGPAMTLLRALVDLPPDRRPSDLDDLLIAAVARFGDDPHLFDGLVELRARLANLQGQVGLRRQQVARWRSVSSDGDAILRVIRLEQALEIARTHGLLEEANEIRRELQNIHPNDLELASVSAEIEVTREQVNEYIASFIDVADWRESLRHLGSEDPPGGASEELDKQMRQEEQEFVFLQLFTRTVMGQQTAATRLRAADPHTRRKLDRAERRAWYARMWSPLAADVLYAIPKRFGRPAHDELGAFFATELIGAQRGERIARAIELFWDNEPDECAHVLVPRLESTIREMARRSGHTIIREPVADAPGGTRSLGTLLLELRGALPDAAWHEYLFNLLADPMGLNLRNTVAHGLVDRVGHGDAALLIHAACYLRLLGVATEDEST